MIPGEKNILPVSYTHLDNHSSTEKKGMKKQNAVSGCSNMLHAIMPEDVLQAALLAFILTMLFLQAGRLNHELDYDSLHYGLRSPYIPVSYTHLDVYKRQAPVQKVSHRLGRYLRWKTIQRYLQIRLWLCIRIMTAAVRCVKKPRGISGNTSAWMGHGK